MNFGRIVIVGFGNMGKALARGLQRGFSDGTVREIIVCVRNANITQNDLPPGLFLSQLTILTADLVKNNPSNFVLTSEDTLIICTKPQHFIVAADFWKQIFIPDTADCPLIISILAGVTTDLVQKNFSLLCPIVRAMPNIAATVDCSATAYCAGPGATQYHLDRAKAIFDAVGRSWSVPEDLLNAVTGLSGSGPAYIYMVIEALSDGGVKMGLPRQLSLDLATQTVLGAAKLVQETKLHPAVLRDQVTTPGGTTIAAIHELEKHGLRPMLISAVVTATQRSKYLAKTVEKAILKSIESLR